MPTPPDISTFRFADKAWRIVCWAWAVLLILICIRAWLLPARNTVYPIFSNAAHNWVQSESLYDEKFVAMGIDQYRYSPIVTVFFVPLAMLPDNVGGVLWRLLNMAVFLGGFAWYCRELVPGRDRLATSTLAILGLAALPLSLSSLNNGQANPLVLGALLIAVVAVSQERWNLAAFALTVPILFKLYPVALALLLVVAFPKQLGWRLTVMLGLGLALPFLFQHPAYVSDQYQQWFHYLVGEDRSQRPLPDSYRDFHLLTRIVQYPLSRPVYLLVQLATAAGLAGIVLFARMRRWETRELLHHLFNLGCVWIILFGPATENCTYILLSPTLAFACWEASAGRRPVWTWLLLAAIVGLFLASVVITAFPGGRNLTYILNPLAALLLLGERLLVLRSAPETQRRPETWIAAQAA